MRIVMNGKPQEVGKRISLAEFVLSRSLKAEEIAIEQNGRIVPKQEWLNTYLEENDKIEIVSFFGGG